MYIKWSNYLMQHSDIVFPVIHEFLKEVLPFSRGSSPDFGPQRWFIDIFYDQLYAVIL